MYSLRACKSTHCSHIKVNDDHTASLGPWPDSMPETDIKNYRQEVRRPILAFLEGAAMFTKWQRHHQAVRMGSWPKPSEEELSWYQARKAMDLARWQEIWIGETIELCFSLENGVGNRTPLVAVACFWDTSSNTFNFRFGQMGITLLDILTITGLLVCKLGPWGHVVHSRHKDHHLPIHVGYGVTYSCFFICTS